MCGGWYFGGFPFMWLGGTLGLIAIVMISVLGTMLVVTHSKHKQ